MSGIIIPGGNGSEDKVDPSKLISPEELNSKVNIVFATCINPETKEIQIVINQSNKYVLWAAWKDLEEVIKWHLNQIELKKQATAVQAVPASVLERLNGK